MHERSAEIHLRPRPVERNPLARIFSTPPAAEVASKRNRSVFNAASSKASVSRSINVYGARKSRTPIQL
jgi:hypothetical protein